MRGRSSCSLLMALAFGLVQAQQERLPLWRPSPSQILAAQTSDQIILADTMDAWYCYGVYRPPVWHARYPSVEEMGLPAWKQAFWDASAFSAPEREATAETVVQDYTLEVRGVTGCGHISRVSFFLTGQSRSCFIGQPGREPDESTVYFDGDVEESASSLTASFSTFGKLPSKEAVLYVAIEDKNGNGHHSAYDVSLQMTDSINPSRHIVVGRADIDIPEAVESGMGTEAEAWNEIVYEINL